MDEIQPAIQLPSARRVIALRLPLDQTRHEVEAVPVRLQVDPLVVLLRARLCQDAIVVAVIAARVQRGQAVRGFWSVAQRHTTQQTVVGRDRVDAQALMRLNSCKGDFLVADVSGSPLK